MCLLFTFSPVVSMANAKSWPKSHPLASIARAQDFISWNQTSHSVILENYLPTLHNSQGLASCEHFIRAKIQLAETSSTSVVPTGIIMKQSWVSLSRRLSQTEYPSRTQSCS